jgi:lipopolysaccharide/colanic/teichoic acid biosynthesis glycosyltransferase
MKRAFDMMLSGAGLLASAPLWGLFGLAIKLEDGGPIFFTQERVGQHGRIFKALKFRSMRPDAEQFTGAVQASENDPRVTRVGRLMRATAMDELPQLWNIFGGDMSFVGPGARSCRSKRCRAMPRAPPCALASPASPRSTRRATCRGGRSFATTGSTCGGARCRSTCD